MRDDLLGAQAAVDWAIAQIPPIQESLIQWQRGSPYVIVREADAESGGDIVVAVQQTPCRSLSMHGWEQRQFAPKCARFACHFAH
jgi:hypothetical protein